MYSRLCHHVLGDIDNLLNGEKNYPSIENVLFAIEIRFGVHIERRKLVQKVVDDITEYHRHYQHRR